MNTMQEVEAKVLDTTEASLLPRIRELGFEPYFVWELRAQWLVSMINWEKLRVRQEGSIIRVEHKASAKQAGEGIKSMGETGFDARNLESDDAIKTLGLVGLHEEDIRFLKETGFETLSFDASIVALGLLGLDRSGLPSVKSRVSHVLDYNDQTERVRLDFDTYSNLMGKPIPEFLEIEAKYEERVYAMADALGIDRSALKDYGPLDLFRHYYPDEEIV